jgi:CBS domain containing-hemolysin-like protein
MIPNPMPALFAFAPISEGDIAGGTWSALLFYIGFALVSSFICSLLEASLLSSSRTQLETMVENGSQAGKLMLKHKLNVERPISAVLTLNTIAHTVGAAGAGAQAAAIFGSQYVGIISAVLTLLILVFTEIIPKTLGAVYWRSLVPFTAYGVQALVFALYPFVWAFERLGQFMHRKTEEPTFTRQELATLATIGEQEGTLEAQESRLLKNLLQLKVLHVSDVMTPRTVVRALKANAVVQDVAQKYDVLTHSRLPIYTNDLDDSDGYVLRHDILRAVAEDRHDTPLSALKKPIGVVNETLSLEDALERFVSERKHIMLVIDEFGGVAGIITLEDAIETLLGIEILDESDTVEDMRALALQRVRERREGR